MTELFTTLSVFLPALTVVATALHTPRDAAGNKVPRTLRTFTGDLRSLVGLS